MPTITLKALPVSVHRALKVRAAQHKRSLNQEVLLLLEAAVAPSRKVDLAAMLEETRAFRASLSLTAGTDEIVAFKRGGRA
jgi:plasmid stability protein